MNFGARARQEVQLTKTVAVVGGATVERTNLDGLQHSFIYNGMAARRAIPPYRQIAASPTSRRSLASSTRQAEIGNSTPASERVTARRSSRTCS